MDASETETADMDNTTELTEPVVQPLNTPPTSLTPTFHDVEEGEFLPDLHSSLSYPPESPTSKEALIMIHEAVENEEKTKTFVQVGDE